MSDPVSGSAATVEISHDGATWTDISVATYGLDGLDISDEEGTTEKAGGGNRTGTLATGYVQNGASFTVDETELTRPLLHGYNGGTLHVRYRRTGAGSGKKQEVSSGPATISHDMAAQDKRRYSVDIMVNGAVTRSTQ